MFKVIITCILKGLCLQELKKCNDSLLAYEKGIS